MKKIAKYTELNKLKGLMREKNISYRKMAELLGIGANTFSDKVNGFTLFDAVEIATAAEILEVALDDVKKYFFPSVLRNSTKKRSA